MNGWEIQFSLLNIYWTIQQVNRLHILIRRMRGERRHWEYPGRSCQSPERDWTDSWERRVNIDGDCQYDLYLSVRSTADLLGLSTPDCLKEEESMYFSGASVLAASFSFSSSLTSCSTSKILFWVSMGKRWRGILGENVNKRLLVIFLYLWPVSSCLLSGKKYSTANWLPRGVAASISTLNQKVTEPSQDKNSLPASLVADPHLSSCCRSGEGESWPDWGWQQRIGERATCLRLVEMKVLCFIRDTDRLCVLEYSVISFHCN